MKSITIGVLAVAGLAALCGAGPGNAVRGPEAVDASVDKAVHWLVSVQGNDGGWGQDGGATSVVRAGERLETNGNDVANTAVAALALIRSGHTPARGAHRAVVAKAVEFVLRSVENSPLDGLAITSVTGSQIQRKLGPYIDTFLTSMLLAEVDGNMGDRQANARVRQALEKCVAKIQANQQRDGSWNISGGWAPILGTSMASRSLDAAYKKGVKVDMAVVGRVDEYTKKSAAAPVPAGGRPSAIATEAVTASAGVGLYQKAQELEQLSRTEKDRRENAAAIRATTSELRNARFVNGFGSMGGEEFFSYLNISDSLRRTGGADWDNWNRDMKTKLVSLQNQDGTWAGHHCITGRVAVTSAAVLTMLVDRAPIAKN